MVTKDQALTANEFHFGTCTRVIGSRGCITAKSDRWRRNGITKTWVTHPAEFQVPIKYGLRNCSYINDMNAHRFHTAADCPLNNPEYVTKDNRSEQTKQLCTPGELIKERLASGRLHPSQPALQNIPINSELGKEIRKKFSSPEES